MPDLSTLQIKAARWLDKERTKLVIVTCFGIGNWPADSDVGKLALKRLPAIEPFYEVIEAKRIGGKLIARVEGIDDRDVMLTPELWPDL